MKDDEEFQSLISPYFSLQAELARVREQLRQAEEQLAASRQHAALLASELRDSASARDHSMTELYRARLEADKLRASLAEAQAECQRMESQLDRMRSSAHKEVVSQSRQYCVWLCIWIHFNLHQLSHFFWRGFKKDIFIFPA